jgi:hypothetical protein
MTEQNGTKPTPRTRDRWKGISDVAHLVGKSKRTVRRWCRDGRVDATKSDGQWLVDLQSLDNPRTQTQGGHGENTPRIDPGQMTEALTELAKENAILEEQLTRALPSGEIDPETLDKLIREVHTACRFPVVRNFFSKDVREAVENWVEVRNSEG